MAAVTNRITSKDVIIQWRHGNGAGTDADAIHVEVLAFEANLTGGTFKLWVNGETTASITMSATPATLITNINAALDALANLSAGDIVATGSVITAITLTGAAVGFYRIISQEITSLTPTPTSGEKTLVHSITTFGATVVTLSADASSFSWEASVGTVDVTAISEYERLEIDVDSSVSFDLSLFEANASWAHEIYEGASGVLSVYQEGKIVGKKWFKMRVLIESFSQDMPDHEKVEIEVSGMRQGAWLVPPHSIYRG